MLFKAVTITRGQTGEGMRNTRRTILSRSLDLAIVAVLLANGACAGVQEPAPESTPLRLLSSNGVRAAIEAVQPQLETATGLRLSSEFSTGGGAEAQNRRG